MNKTSIPSSATIERHVLDNGITVLLFHNPHAQTVVTEGGIWAGAVAESREQAGLASMVAASLMRGTQRYDFDTIFESLESVGASLSFGSGYQMTDFSAESLAEDFDSVLELIASALREPDFPHEQVEKVRAEKLTQLQMRQNNTGSMAQLRFRETLYGDHPYGRSVSGYLDSVARIARDDMVAFHQKQYTPEQAIVTVVGGIEPARALAQIEQKLGGWRGTAGNSQAAIPEASRPEGTQRVITAMPDKTQSDIVLGLPGPRRSVSDYVPVKMANTIFGVFGMMGRLGRNVRERQGLAYYARSVLRPSLGPAPWYISTGVAPDKVEQAIESCRDEIRRIQQQPVSEQELDDSKAYLTGSLPLSLENNSGIADIIFNMELYDLGLDYLLHFADQIQAVTRAQVQAAAQKYFSADNIVISVAGPNSA